MVIRETNDAILETWMVIFEEYLFIERAEGFIERVKGEYTCWNMNFLRRGTLEKSGMDIEIGLDRLFFYQKF